MYKISKKRLKLYIKILTKFFNFLVDEKFVHEILYPTLKSAVWKKFKKASNIDLFVF